MSTPENIKKYSPAAGGTHARLAWPDWIRGAAMIAVVSVHLSGVAGFPDTPLLWWFNSFAMAIFFFVAGDLMERKLQTDAAETTGDQKGPYDSVTLFAARKAASVLWPFLTFSVLAVLFDYAVLRLSGGRPSHEMITVWLRCIFTLVGKGTLWFLPVFFFSSVLAYAALAHRFAGNNSEYPDRGSDYPARSSDCPGRPALPEILVFLAGLGAMTFMDQIFAATVVPITGGGDGIASDIFLVVIRSLAAAAVIVEGAWLGPIYERLTAPAGSINATAGNANPPAGNTKKAGIALLCFAVSLAIPTFYRMDFRTAQFGTWPVLLFVSAAAAYGFLRWAAETAEHFSLPGAAGTAEHLSLPGAVGTAEHFSAFTYFGKYSLIVMATHLEWYLVNVVWHGMTAVTGTPAAFGAGFLVRHLAALALVMMIEYPLCGIISRCLGFLLRLPATRRT